MDRRDFLRRSALVAGATTFPGLWWPEVAGAAQSVVPAPPIITRAEWGADETLVREGRNFAPLTKAIVHHTVIDEVDPAAQIRNILRQHTRNEGYADIGYNFLVDSQGRIYEGRKARAYADGEAHDGEDGTGQIVEGAHASGRNRGSVGIAVLGDFHRSTGATPTTAAITSVAKVIAWKFGPRGIDPYARTPYRRTNGTSETFSEICGHRDVAFDTTHTSCPGDRLYGRLSEIRDLVAAEIQTGLVGIRILGADGSMWLYGKSPRFNRTADIGDVRRNVRTGVPVRTAAGTPTGAGAWVSDVNGSVYAFGDAGFYGSMGGKRLNKPIVGMAPTPSGLGYWLVASDGGIFCFGDAKFFGSTGAMRLNQPIVGMTSSPSGNGYWLVASDGGIFTFGDARFFGSTGAIRLAQPILGMSVAPDGAGYWLVAKDGGVFNFGSARFLGSAVGKVVSGAAALAPTPSGQGYWVLDGNGTVHPFGDAPAFGGGVTAGSRPALGLVPVIRPAAAS